MSANEEKGKQTSQSTQGNTEKRKFIGFSERRRIIREQRSVRNAPQPWIAQKLMVGFVIAVAAYAWYVYIGRFCVPMIRRESGALGGRRMGGECPGLERAFILCGGWACKNGKRAERRISL